MSSADMAIGAIAKSRVIVSLVLVTLAERVSATNSFKEKEVNGERSTEIQTTANHNKILLGANTYTTPISRTNHEAAL